MHIIDGKRHFGTGLADIAQSGHLAAFAKRVGLQVPAMTDISDKPALNARLYRNQWIIECDCPGCKNAEFAFIDEPLFFCSNCFNSHCGRKWRRVKFPPNRENIESVMRARPIPQTRNWSFGETLKALKNENREHGLPEVG